MIHEIKGNLLDAPQRFIAHGVNCQNKMGSGVAKALFMKWPRVKAFYHDYFTEFDPGHDGSRFLGRVDYFEISRGGKIIGNCFTQQYYGPGDKLYLNYDALRQCMKELKHALKNYKLTEIAIPKIGAGLAGGDWDKIKQIIEEELPDIDVYVYYL